MNQFVSQLVYLYQHVELINYNNIPDIIDSMLLLL